MVARDSLSLETAYASPTGETEQIIADIWAQVFSISGIGVDDDFFELGGDSLAAESITRMVSEKFGVSVKSGALVESSTIREIANVISSANRPSLPSHIVPLRSTGNRIPIFIVHGAAGILFPTSSFMEGFHDDQPVYAFQVPGYDGQCQPLDTIEEIAAEYLKCMRMVSPDGPWHLAAFCQGSWIAFEMAAQLGRESKSPSSLTMIDPVMHMGRMLNEHLQFLRSRKNPLARAFSEARWIARVQMDKFRCFRATGQWINPYHPDAYDLPGVWEWIRQRDLARHDTHAQNNARADEPHGVQGKFDTEKELERRRSKDANSATARLEIAYYRYCPNAPLTIPVHLIASEKQNRQLNNPLYPLRRFLPTLTITVLGKTHRQTVSTTGPENSSIIQRVADEASCLV
nr:thioesterase domain-containing protein [Flavimaribacter sediminis]